MNALHQLYAKSESPGRFLFDRHFNWVGLYVLFLGVGLVPVSNSPAQEKSEDGPVGIFESQQQYGSFMGGLKRAARSPEDRAMILMINDIVLNRPFGSSGKQYGGVTSNLGLLANPDVRKELEMVDDQYRDLQETNRQLQKRMADRLRDMDFSDKTTLTDVSEQLGQMRQEANEELGKILLPHQTDRLRQLVFQIQLRRRSLVRVLTSDPVKSDLKITDSQAGELKSAEREIQVELQREIEKLRQRAQDKLLSRLNPEQQRKAKSLIGDPFSFPSKTGKKN